MSRLGARVGTRGERVCRWMCVCILCAVDVCLVDSPGSSGAGVLCPPRRGCGGPAVAELTDHGATTATAAGHAPQQLKRGGRSPLPFFVAEAVVVNILVTPSPCLLVRSCRQLPCCYSMRGVAVLLTAVTADAAAAASVAVVTWMDFLRTDASSRRGGHPPTPHQRPGLPPPRASSPLPAASASREAPLRRAPAGGDTPPPRRDGERTHHPRFCPRRRLATADVGGGRRRAPRRQPRGLWPRTPPQGSRPKCRGFWP